MLYQQVRLLLAGCKDPTGLLLEVDPQLIVTGKCHSDISQLYR